MRDESTAMLASPMSRCRPQRQSHVIHVVITQGTNSLSSVPPRDVSPRATGSDCKETLDSTCCLDRLPIIIILIQSALSVFNYIDPNVCILTVEMN